MRVEISKTNQIIPLKEVNISGEMVDFFGTINTKLVFENSTNDAIEVIYKFTLDTSSVITKFKAQIKDRTLVGVIREKNTVRETYDSAVKNKQSATILELDRNGRYTATFGNIQRGDIVTIEYTYFVTTIQENGKQKLIIPTNIGKKYDPFGYTVSRSYVSEILPMTFTSDRGQNFHINVDWKSNSTIDELTIPTFPSATINKISDRHYNVTATTFPEKGDFVIIANCQLNNNVYSKFSTFDNKTYTVLVTKIPDEVEDMNPKEFIFFLDKSGSMEGSRFYQAKKALEIYLRSLPIGSKFNVILYDNYYKSMFVKSVDYNETNLNFCLTELKKLNAGGGTEMFSCIEATLNNRLNNNHAIIKNVAPIPPNPTNGLVTVPDHLFNNDIQSSTENLEKICVLLTDGDIGNVDQVIQLVNSFKKTTRFFTIGLGDSVDRQLVEKVAKVTGGLSKVVIDEKSIDDCIIEMTTHVYKTHYTDIEVTFDTDVVKYPGVMYSSNYITIFHQHESNEPIHNISIKGTNSTTKQQKIWNVDITTNQTNINDDLLRVLYVHDQITNIDNNLTNNEIIDLSVKHSLMNQLTSFIIVDQIVNDQNNAITIQVPQYSKQFRSDECERLESCSVPSTRARISYAFKQSSLKSAPSASTSSANFDLFCSDSKSAPSPAVLCSAPSSASFSEQSFSFGNSISNAFDSMKSTVKNTFGNTKSIVSNVTNNTNNSIINNQEKFIQNQKTDGHFEVTDENTTVLSNDFDMLKLSEFSLTNGLSETVTFNMLAMIYLTNQHKQSYTLIIRKLRTWIKTNTKLSESEIDNYLDTVNITFSRAKLYLA